MVSFSDQFDRTCSHSGRRPLSMRGYLDCVDSNPSPVGEVTPCPSWILDCVSGGSMSASLFFLIVTTT